MVQIARFTMERLANAMAAELGWDGIGVRFEEIMDC